MEGEGEGQGSGDGVGQLLESVIETSTQHQQSSDMEMGDTGLGVDVDIDVDVHIKEEVTEKCGEDKGDGQEEGGLSVLIGCDEEKEKSVDCVEKGDEAKKLSNVGDVEAVTETETETGMDIDETDQLTKEDGTTTGQTSEVVLEGEKTGEGSELKSPTTEKSFIVPLSSPKIPSLSGPSDAGRGDKISHVSNKDILPTLPPPSAPVDSVKTKQELSSEVNGNSVGNLNKLLASTKSLSFALAKPNPAVEGTVASALETSSSSRDGKRKLHGGCSNGNCVTNSDNLVIARKAAMLYFRFNTSYKKVHKICTECNDEAEMFLKNSVNALKTDGNVFEFKPKPQGMEGDVIEVNEDEEEDDPRDVQRLEAEENEIVGIPSSLDDIIGSIMAKLDLKSQIQKCEQTAAIESANLEREFSILEKQISFVEKQVGETKKMYDKVTGYYQAVPVITEELDISATGVITKTRAKNEHLQNIPNLPQLPPGVFRRKSESSDGGGEAYQNRPRRAKENRPHYADDSEIMEVESAPSSLQKTSCPLARPPKEIPRVVPVRGSIVYAQNRTLLHFWLKSEIEEIVDVGPNKSPEFVVRFEKRQGPATKKRVTAKQIAYNIHCPFILVVGTRIIAKFRDELKTEPIGDGQHYAGIVAEPPNGPNGYRYLIFFDDGYAQYVDYKDVLLVYEYSKEVWCDVHPDSSDFIKSYILKYPERPMVRMSLGQVVTTEWNGKWWVARVQELDCSLVKMKFENDGRNEWIYRGSTRLSPLYEKQTRQKTRKTARRTTSAPIYNKNTPRIEYNYGDDDLLPTQEKNNRPPKPASSTAKKSTGAHQALEKQYGETRRLARLDYGEFEGTIIKRPVPPTAPKTRDYVPHNCGSSCVHQYKDYDKDNKKMSPLAIPLHLGFSREIAKNPRRSIFYRGPCGVRIRDLDEMYDYLTQTNCEVPIDHFCFDLAVDCLNEFRHSRQHSFLPDLTYGKEAAPVQVVNAFDYEYPPYVEYASQRIAGAGVHLNTDGDFLVGCECEDDCRDKSKCRCWQMTFSGISFTKLNNPEYPVRGYEYRRLKDHIVSGVYECNPKCKCSKTCCNKVAQNGLKVPLQVFKTAAKGWGIRPLFDIPEGAFICIYAGQVLTDAGANEDGKQFGDEYLAELDYIESIESVKAEYESDVTDIETEEPGERSKKRKARKERSSRDAREESDEEVDYHAGDSSYRGPKPSASERTVSTRGKQNRGQDGSGGSSKNSESDDEDASNGGARPRSHFNADVVASNKKVTDRRPLREYFGEDEECYIMDAKTTGNIGRYLNHSCQPNVFVQNVFVDTHDLRFPWVAFFASKHIRAGSELTWDYNYEIGSVPSKVLFCYCGSPDCRGRLL